MPRRHRFIPADQGPVVVAVMTRCFQSRCFLVKTREAAVRDLYFGVWAHALDAFPDVKLGSLVTQPNHYHAQLILERPDTELLSDFMAVVNSSIARELNRQLGRTGTFWGARYSAIVIAESQRLERLKYDHSNGVKSGDYAHPSQNPLPNTTDAQRFGRTIKCLWVRQGEMADARCRGQRVREADFTDRLELRVSPIPMPAGTFEGEDAPRDYSALMRRVVEEAADQGTAEREARQIALRDLRVLKRLDPFTRPASTKTGNAVPQVFGSKVERAEFRAGYRRMRETQFGALKGLAAQMTACGWPGAAHRPPPLRMAAANLAARVSARAV